MVLETFRADRTSFAPETIRPKRNEQDQSPPKMQENQRSRAEAALSILAAHLWAGTRE
jgi:hypothetical protein